MILSLERVFVLISVSFVLTAGSDVKDEGEREANSDRQGLWFGPRLGKRSSQMSEEDNRDLYLRMMEAADAMQYYYNQLPVSLLERSEPDTRVPRKELVTIKLVRVGHTTTLKASFNYVKVISNETIDMTKKVIFTPKLGRSVDERGLVEFTPRLGRRLIDDTPQRQHTDEDRTGSRTRYYSPRLGRTMNFSPRLGRELIYDNYPGSVRVARSVNKTKNSQN